MDPGNGDKNEGSNTELMSMFWSLNCEGSTPDLTGTRGGRVASYARFLGKLHPMHRIESNWLLFSAVLSLYGERYGG